MIGLFMGIGYAIGFTLSGLKFGIALGLLFGLLNIVPYLGSIVGIGTALLVAYLQPGGISETGEWTVLLGCGASFVVVQLIESYYLTPKIMGQQTGLHPVVVIVSIFFWGSALGGILGMIFGIPLTAFIIIAWAPALPQVLHPYPLLNRLDDASQRIQQIFASGKDLHGLGQ